MSWEVGIQKYDQEDINQKIADKKEMPKLKLPKLKRVN